MRKKITNILLFLLVLAAGIGLTIYVGQNAWGMMIYNFVFLGIMAVLFLTGMFGGMFRVLNLAESLKTGANNLSQIFKEMGKADQKKLELLPGIFHHKYLDDKLDNFSQAVSLSEEGIAEIEEYINEEEIDIHVHKRLLEMVPDILTSLGILGTFVGLVWGLKDFEPSNYEAMTNSVSSLVEGIKVAFLTSIYGISLSIIYSYGMKSAYSSLGERLQSFLEKFHSCVLPTAENESRNLMISSAKQQSEMIGKMTEKAAADMSESFQRAVAPVFDKMSNTLESLVHSIGSYQEEAMDEIVQGFLREMNKTFRIQLTNFDGALEDLRKAQVTNTEYTENLYKNLSKELNDSFVKQQEMMQSSVHELLHSVDGFSKSARDFTAGTQEIQKQTRVDYEHVLSYMKEAERSSAEFWVACNQAMQKYVELAAGSTEKLGNAGKVSAAVIRENRGILQTLDERIQKYAQQEQESMKAMKEFQRLLSDMTAERKDNEISLQGGVISRNRDYERLQKTIEAQGERQEELLEELIASVRELSKASKKSKIQLFK